ncbi:MAG: ATP-binding cassette domain-containing protein [Dehalococcoidales bacterium]|nr:ATP-binding cassette domain-containing protein [Dehalococcoidales bacterium]
MPQILVEDLRKTFKVNRRQSGFFNSLKAFAHRQTTTVNALNGISFNLEEGELVGYIGPNGAGKSTTIKIMSGILTPDSGKCEVMGRIPWRQRIEHVRRIGVVFGQRTQLWWDVPVGDSFDLLKDIYKIPFQQYQKTKNELVESLGLQKLVETPVRQLSLGQKMRCELAASLLHQPQILFLDEPTIGLDAVSKLAVRDFIKKINRERGVTVILTTHDMDDIEALCSRIMLIGKGKILLDGTIEQIRNRISPERIMTIDFVRTPPSIAFPGVNSVRGEDGRLELHFNPSVISATDLINRITANNEIKDFIIENLPIEETIARMYDEFKI